MCSNSVKQEQLQQAKRCAAHWMGSGCASRRSGSLKLERISYASRDEEGRGRAFSRAGLDSRRCILANTQLQGRSRDQSRRGGEPGPHARKTDDWLGAGLADCCAAATEQCLKLYSWRTMLLRRVLVRGTGCGGAAAEAAIRHSEPAAGEHRRQDKTGVGRARGNGECAVDECLDEVGDRWFYVLWASSKGRASTASSELRPLGGGAA
ncbi:hypothetical protein BKA63DRAFT_67423 [Paraphoma chrysanthemicola]|nr:hypothetical protein BKA63DRAFT_67423 [Paraphoma chrysanthemicola]